MHKEGNNKMMEIIDDIIPILGVLSVFVLLGICMIGLIELFQNSLEKLRFLFKSIVNTLVQAYKPPAPTRKYCSLCNNGENSINSISGLTITSPYSIYDLGWLDDVEYCPCCGRKLKKVESKIIPKSNK